MKQYFYTDGSPIEIGDRVICVIAHPDDNGDIYAGDFGTVVTFTDDGYYRPIGVSWDNQIVNGHELFANDKPNAADGHGWWVHEKEIGRAFPEQAAFEPAASADIYAMLGMK